jgi:thioredoxin 1
LKKLLIIGGVIIAFFILIVFLSNQAGDTKLKSKDNPYDKKNLKQSSIDLIGNPNYSNVIMPDKLAEKINSGEGVMAYFFSPECGYCKQMTPVLMPIAQEMNVHIDQYNLLEYSNTYGIEATPTLIYFEDGKEVERMVGAAPDEDIRQFLNKHGGK